MQIKKMNKIYLFTHTYPYGHTAETFLEDEVKVANSIGVHVVVIPLYKLEYKRPLPNNITVYDGLANMSLFNKVCVFLTIFLKKWSWKLLFQKERPYSLNCWKQALKYLYGGFLIEYFMRTHKSFFEQDSILYSYWCNHTPLGLSWAKLNDNHYKDCRIYSRAHGFDVYEEEVGVYIPYRDFVLKNIDKVFVVSEKGAEFMRCKYKQHAQKIEISRLGVFDNNRNINTEIGTEAGASLSFVSCSSVIPVKRVELIFSSIVNYCQNNREIRVEWTHIGGGEDWELLSSKVKNMVCDNLTISLTGSVSRDDVMKIYSENHFDIFINMSLSEGIPVSIMEAISWGIPVIATNVGGNNEIVTTQTGCLLPVDFKEDEFGYAVVYIKRNQINYRKSTYEYYVNEYNAQVNYRDFYLQLLL